MTNTTILDIDSLLDQDMGSVETLPDYVTPATGQYRLRIKEVGIKEGRKPKDGEAPKTSRIVAVYEILDTKSVDSNEPPFPNGSLFNRSWQATEEGLQYFKKDAMNTLNVTDLTGAKLRDIFETLAGTEVFAVVTSKKTKADDGKEYNNINMRCVHDTPAA